MQPTEIAPGLHTQCSPASWRLSDYRLIAFDMDSTLINIECVDEIADAAGSRAEVAAITEAAMQGEVRDFKDSLRRRVALLKGVTLGAMEHIYQHRLQVNPGAVELIAACKAAGLQVLLVSGGFTYYSDRLCKQLGIDYSRANVLEVKNGALTGRLLDQDWGDICDAEQKRATLEQTCAHLGIATRQAIAMGDGANDLAMMGAAGLSVAYHAKPIVRQRAHVCIDSGGLDRLLTVLR